MKIVSNNLKIVCVLMTLPFLQVNAQDGHYWSENFGNKSMLLSGTVNASVTDLGAVYYNPGRLGQIENPAFVIFPGGGVDFLWGRLVAWSRNCPRGHGKIDDIKTQFFMEFDVIRDVALDDFFMTTFPEGDL